MQSQKLPARLRLSREQLYRTAVIFIYICLRGELRRQDRNYYVIKYKAVILIK